MESSVPPVNPVPKPPPPPLLPPKNMNLNSTSAAKKPKNKIPNILLAVVSGLALVLVVIFFSLSFVPSDEFRGFQGNLENGDINKTSVSKNLFRGIQVFFRGYGALNFKKKVENFDGNLAPLNDSYPSAVGYLAYDPNSPDVLSSVARYYFLSGKPLPAEALALKAVTLDPYNLYSRRVAVLCQALTPENRERFEAASWDLINKNMEVIRYYTDAKTSGKIAYYGFYLFERYTKKYIFTHSNDDFLSVFASANQKRLEFLDKEENWIKHQYAFSLFLTDPLRWENDAADALNDPSINTDPESLENRYVVALWKDNAPLVQTTYQQLTREKSSDPLVLKRIESVNSVFKVAQGYDQKIEALKVYDPVHPDDENWANLEGNAMNFPQDFQPSAPDAEGAENWKGWLDKIASGQESIPPGQTRDDYAYPQFAEVRQLLDSSLTQTQTLPVCPLVMPLKDESGHYTPLGGYISATAITSACFPGQMVLGPWSPFSTFKEWLLLEHTGKELKYVRQELLARTGAASYAEGTLLSNKNGGWTVDLTFKSDSKTATYSNQFKKNHLHLIPNWIAQTIHLWLGTPLTRAEKKELKKPVFSDDDSLTQSLVLENFDVMNGQIVPGWDGLYEKNLKSPFVLFRHFGREKDVEDISDLKPLETLHNKDKKNELASYFLSYAYIRQYMLGKAIDLQIPFLAKDQANPSHYDDMGNILEPLNDYENLRYLYEKMAARFPENGQVQYATGNFFVNYAWVARGSDWGYSVTPWNYFLFKKRLEIARKYLERAEVLNPKDCRIYSALLTVGKGQGWKKEEFDKVFNQSVSIDPDFYDSYDERMDIAQQKWYGSDKEAMEFAKRWQKIHPLLMLEALRDQAPNNDNDRKDYYHYFSMPEHWSELNTAYQNYLKIVDMDDYDSWINYCYDAAYTNRLNDFFTFLKSEAEKDEILKHFMPYLIIEAYEYRAQAVGIEHEGQLYLNSKEVWPDYYQAQMQALKQDPTNYAFINQRAMADVGWGRFKLARYIFGLIGDHWIPKVWTKQKFDQFKRIAFGKEKPTWHLCLSPEEIRSEQ